jgi:hypothetical protein
MAVNLRRDAEACVAASNRRDLNTVASYLPERVYPDRHARYAAVKEIESDLASLYDPSFRVSLGTLQKPRRYRNLYATILPVVVVVEWSSARMTENSYLLAVSQNGGQSWKFLPLYEVQQHDVDRFFPEFERKIQVPQSLPPVTQILIPSL